MIITGDGGVGVGIGVGVQYIVCVRIAFYSTKKVTEMVNLKFKFNWIFVALDIELSRIEKE